MFPLSLPRQLVICLKLMLASQRPIDLRWSIEASSQTGERIWVERRSSCETVRNIAMVMGNGKRASVGCMLPLRESIRNGSRFLHGSWGSVRVLLS